MHLGNKSLSLSKFKKIRPVLRVNIPLGIFTLLDGHYKSNKILTLSSFSSLISNYLSKTQYDTLNELLIAKDNLDISSLRKPKLNLFKNKKDLKSYKSYSLVKNVDIEFDLNNNYSNIELDQIVQQLSSFESDISTNLEKNNDSIDLNF
jgi:hypothetical protein